VNGRRRNPRYDLSRGFEGTLQTLSDVIIEHRDSRHLVALGDVALRRGLSLALDVFSGSTRRTLPVTVLESSPVIHGGTLRHRLHLASVGGGSDATDRDGLLVIDTPVRVIDISEHGLLLEAGGRVDAGTLGLARIEIDGTVCDGHVRVVRCTRVESVADRHRVGAEFLRTERAPHGSPLRHALVNLLKAHI
jgi:hypothetical protein